MSNSFYHKDLTDTQWNRIKIVFEEKPKVGRPPLNPRTVFNALMWILKSGGRWRDLPARYGNWNSIYHKFRKWCSLGCSALKEQAIGSSRGGKNTKIHVLLNERMQLLKVILTGGQIHDSEPALALLNGIKLKGKTILADKAYSSEQIRFFIAEHGAFACIPDKANFKIMPLILNCTNNAISSSVFFSESKITATSPLVTTNWLFAFSISFYLLLVLFTFNLPTTPSS